MTWTLYHGISWNLGWQIFSLSAEHAQQIALFKCLIGWHQSCAYNSLRPSDAIWRQMSWTTLAWVMACCLMAPIHYLNQCWLINKVLWQSHEGYFRGDTPSINWYHYCENCSSNISIKFSRGQWDKVCSRMWYITMNTTFCYVVIY